MSDREKLLEELVKNQKIVIEELNIKILILEDQNKELQLTQQACA